MKQSISKIKNLIERIRNSNQQQIIAADTQELTNGATLRSLSNDDLSVRNRKRKYYMKCPIKSTNPKEKFKSARIRLKGYKLWSKIGQDVKSLGTNSNLFDAHDAYRENLEYVMEHKKMKVLKQDQQEENNLGLLFHPDSKFRTYWYFLVLIAVFYVVTGMPLVLAFSDVNPGSGIFIFETIIDLIFFFDILITLNSAFINSHGELETNRWIVAKNYLTGFFFLDVMAIFPFWYLTDYESESKTHLTRMIRLTKLTRIFRISKIIPIIRTVIDSKSMSNLLDFFLNYQGTTRLITIIYSIIIIAHYISCIWYYLARLDGFYPDTWVARLKVDENSSFELYLRGLYFAFTVMNTVGFGDIKPYQNDEIALCILIMMFGICFYSFLVATLTSILTSIDVNTSRLNSKKNILDDLQAKYNISTDLKKRIHRYIKKTKYGDINSFIETINKLPKKLQFYLVISMHDSAPQEIKFLTSNEERFAIELIPRMSLRNYKPSEVVYAKGSLPFELYMISKGRVSHVFGSNNIEINVFQAGSYFGDVELSKYYPRKFTAITGCFSEILTVSSKILWHVLSKFPKISKSFHTKAEIQEHKNTQNLNEILDLLEMTQVAKLCSLQDLAGKKPQNTRKPIFRPKLSTVFFRKTFTSNKFINENNSKIGLFLQLQDLRVEVESLSDIINKLLMF